MNANRLNRARLSIVFCDPCDFRHSVRLWPSISQARMIRFITKLAFFPKVPTRKP